MADDGNVKVFCRVRPPNEREGGATPYAKTCVTVPLSDPLQQTVQLQLKGTAPAQPKTFTFDRVFHEHASQRDVFEVVGVPITKACLEGYNGTIFAYGQTGSGKTFTMQGPDDVIDPAARRLSTGELGLRGLVPRVLDYLFQESTGATRVAANGTDAVRVEHTFACSFMEIYNERVYDLLDQGSTRDSTGLILRENGRKGVTVEGLIESVVSNAQQAAALMATGARNRRVGQTAMNRESSRSHSVFVLQIQSKETGPDGLTRKRTSRLNLVDLAGSERQKNTEAAGERLKEAGSINKSLSALGNVIKGLGEQSAGKNRHVHYRDSKLTFLLKDSLGGNSKTFMIAAVSPADDSSHETLSTLQFAARAKLIRNNAVVNEDTIGNVLAMQEEITRLRRQLQQARGNASDIVSEGRLAHSAESLSDAPMDPASSELSERLLELEDALAFSLEQNEELKRSNGHLSMQSNHLHAMCTDMKKSISHLKLLRRLRNNGPSQDDAMVDDEPSADAIEWRMKYEDLEEAYVELQDRIRDGRALRSIDDSDVEVQKLNLMYFTLSKQLAHVIRDKHSLQGRLQLDSPSDVDLTDSVARQEAQLAAQAIEFESRLNTAQALVVAAEERAEVASLELLHSKQKEAAWKVEQQQTEIVIAELQARMKELEDQVTQAREGVHNESRRHVEAELTMRQEAATAQQELEQMLAETTTENFELQSVSVSLTSRLEDAERLAVEHAEFKRAQESARRELERELAEVASQLKDKSVQIKALEDGLAHFKASLESITAERDTTQERVQVLELEREQQRASLQGFEKELEKSAELLHITEEALRECKAELVDRSARYESTIKTAEDEFAVLKARLASTVGEHETHVAKLLAGHQDQVASMREDIDTQAKKFASDLEQLREQLRAEEARFEQATKDHESAVRDLRRILDETQGHLEAEKQQHTTDKNQAARDIADLTHSHQRDVAALEEAAAKQMHDYDTTITNLKGSLDSARATVVKRDAAIVELSGKITKLQQDVARAELKSEADLRTIQGLKEDRATLQASVEKLEKRIAEEVDEKRAAQACVGQLEVELRGQVDLVHQHENTISASQELAERLKKELKERVSERDRLTTELETARHEFADAVSAHAAEVKKLSDESNTTIKTLESTVAALNGDLETNRAEVSKLSSEIEQHISTTSELTQLLTTEKAAKESALGKLRDAEHDLEDRGRRLVEKDECLDRANQQIEEIEESAKEERVRQSGRIQVLEADLKDLARAHDVLTCSHDTLSKQHEDTVDEKRQLETAHASETQRASDLSLKLQDSLSRITAMSTAITDLEAKLALQTQETQRLLRKNEESDKLVVDLRATVAQRDEEIDEKDSVLSGMEETIENLEAAKAQVVMELMQAKEAEADVNEKLTASQSELGCAVNEHKQVEERLQQQLRAVADELAAAKELISTQEASLARDLERIQTLSSEASELSTRATGLEEQIKRDELTRQDMERKHEEVAESLKSSLSTASDELHEVKAAHEGITKSLQEKEEQLSANEKALARTQGELREAKSTISAVEQTSASQLEAWSRQESDLKQRIDVLQRQLEQSQQDIQDHSKQAGEVEKSQERVIQQLRQELEDSVEKAARQRKRNDTLHERNDQLSLELDQKTTKIAENVKRISTIERELEVSQAQQAQREDELSSTKLLLSSTGRELAELSAKHDQLVTEYATAREDLVAKAAAWEAKDKELRGRMTVVGEMEGQIADESKKVTEEKVLVAQRKKEYERIKNEYEQLKTRVSGLETLKIQLSKEKDKYRREVLSLTQRLDDISKENDKLVGHDNKRQRIQHHIKVKEENNRLIEEVRKLTDEKIKLEVRIRKLELSLKEKENLVNKQLLLDGPRSPSPSRVANRAPERKLQSEPASTTKAVKPAVDETIDGTPSKKRLRSRLDVNSLAKMASLVDVARAMEKEKEKSPLQLSQAGATAPSKPVLSLVDVAKDHQQKATQPAKIVTLMDVARKTEAEQAKKEAAVSLQNLAAEINEEERTKIDKAITKVAAQVKQEKEQQRSAILKATANEVRREETVDKSRQQGVKTAMEPDSSLQTTPPRPTQPAPVAEADDEGGYSSFEEEEAETKKAVKPSAPQKKPTKEKGREKCEIDNQSDEGSSGEPQKTTPSDSPQAKEFLRAVYRGDLRNVRDMMSDDGVDANTADQHGWSALHWSASQGQTEILSYLLKDESAQVNAVEHMSGWTALHVAVVRDNVTCVKKLLAAGADLKVRDAYGDTVYDIARAFKGKRKERLLQLLDQHRHALR